MRILILGPFKQKIFKKFRIEELIKFLEKDGNFIFHTDKKVNLNFLKRKKIEFIISNGYSYKLSPAIIKNYLNKAINLHNAYLPFGRGIGTNLFCLIRGMPTGISIHYMDNNWDTGPLLIRKKINPKKNETFRIFYLRLLKETNLIFMKNWKHIKSQKIKKIKQEKKKIDTSTRLRTEFMLEYFNKSYDIEIREIIKFRDIFLNNEIFYEKL